ncbi:DUF2971 domain-containing protein [Sorangium sp. So ce185]|uniref:DUF2971 domain-containing protein n=1 Tax=Sorangium sp. So ce185 TaxID=3133287 RepID=UPI003F62C68F
MDAKQRERQRARKLKQDKKDRKSARRREAEKAVTRRVPVTPVESRRLDPPAAPAYLYKYVGTANHHFAIVENLEIRFSQPSVLNDPQDCQPQVVAPRDLQAAVDRIIQRNVVKNPGLWSKAEIARARSDLLRSYRTNIDKRIQESADVLRRNLDVLGVLSLADTPDSLDMWTRYADDHRGFAIEFDTRYGPLIQRPGESGWQGLPAPVTYQPNRPEAFCDSAELELPDELVLVKTTPWSYEREWRVVRDRATADRIVSPGATEVSLFSIDPRAISAIYVGKDASASNAQRLRDALARNAALTHVRLVHGSVSDKGHLVFA